MTKYTDVDWDVYVDDTLALARRICAGEREPGDSTQELARRVLELDGWLTSDVGVIPRRWQ